MSRIYLVCAEYQDIFDDVSSVAYATYDAALAHIKRQRKRLEDAGLLDPDCTGDSAVGNDERWTIYELPYHEVTP
jgi:hypothetical protein